VSTIAPPSPRSIIDGITARADFQTPVRLMSIMSSHCCSVSSHAGPVPGKPRTLSSGARANLQPSGFDGCLPTQYVRKTTGWSIGAGGVRPQMTPRTGERRMFNQLTPADIVGAIGVTARDAARSQDRTSDFQRDQLLSAYSATRHLAAELASYGPEFDRFTAQAAERIRGAAAQDAEGAQKLSAVAQTLEADPDVATVGAALCDLLARLRDADSPVASALRTDLQAQIRQLADREVDLLAEALA
jgi:hypothetical protein